MGISPLFISCIVITVIVVLLIIAYHATKYVRSKFAKQPSIDMNASDQDKTPSKEENPLDKFFFKPKNLNTNQDKTPAKSLKSNPTKDEAKQYSFEYSDILKADIKDIRIYIYSEKKIFPLKEGRQWDSVLKWQKDQISNTHVVYTDRKHVFLWGHEYYALLYNQQNVPFEQVEGVPNKPASPKKNIDDIKQWDVHMWYYDPEEDKGVFYQHIHSGTPQEYGLRHISANSSGLLRYIVCNISYDVKDIKNINNDPIHQEWGPKLIIGFNNLQKETAIKNLKAVESFVTEVNTDEIQLEGYIKDGKIEMDRIVTYLSTMGVQDNTIVEWCRNYIYYWCTTNRKDLKVEMPDKKLLSNGVWSISQIPERCARHGIYEYPPARNGFQGNSKPLEQAKQYLDKYYEITDGSILNKFFNKNAWVKVATGYEEPKWTTLVKSNNNSLWRVEGNRVWLKQESGTEMDTGEMFLLTIEELKKNITYDSTANPNRIQIRQPTDNKTPNPADIKGIMSNKKLAEGGMFQAASQFNALECKNDKTPSYNHKFFTMYEDDDTQGPTLSLTAIYSAIARRDCIYIHDDNNKSQHDQDLNYLSNVKNNQGKPYFNVTNGYFQSYGVVAEEFPKDGKVLENLRDKVKVVFQKDIPIIHDTRGRPFHTIMDLDKQFRAHQVYTAAMDIKQATGSLVMGNGPGNPDENDLRCVDFILDAAYESSYLAAHYCGAKTLWLTLVGGSAFGNPTGRIINAININHKRWGRGLQVIVCDYQGILALDKNSYLVMK